MSTSFNRGMPRIPTPPVTSFHYREMPLGVPSLPRVKPAALSEPAVHSPAEIEISNAELQGMLSEARKEGVATEHARLLLVHRSELQAEMDRVSAAIDSFERERKGYFARVETEVVRLALSIAAKILHREAQVDPLLVGALVQIAMSQLKENTLVSLRVHPDSAVRWRTYFDALAQGASVSIVEDGELAAGDCVLETELGSANFSLDAQLKEVEQGFFDVLAQTPRG